MAMNPQEQQNRWDAFKPTDVAYPEGYKPALRCERCGHFLMPHDVKGHERWHDTPSADPDNR